MTRNKLKNRLRAIVEGPEGTTPMGTAFKEWDSCSAINCLGVPKREGRKTKKIDFFREIFLFANRLRAFVGVREGNLSVGSVTPGGGVPQYHQFGPKVEWVWGPESSSPPS